MKTIIRTFYVGCFSWLFFSLFAQEKSDWTLTQARRFVKSRIWAQGISLSPHRSTDRVAFASQYAKNKALWDKAFLFLKEQDLATLPLGTYPIEEGRCWATVSEYTPKKAEEAKLESHKRFIDLQYTIRGSEKMGLIREGAEIAIPYNEKRDVAFYHLPDKMRYYPTSPEYFFLFFPNDLHQPSVRRGSPVQSRKIVIKIEYKE